MSPPSARPESFDDVLENLPVGITVTHFPTESPAEGILVAVNPAASRTVGFDLSEFIGMAPATDGVDDRFDPEETESNAKRMFDVATGGRMQAFDNFEVEHGPGKGHYQATIVPLPGRRAATVFRRVDHEVTAREALDWAMSSLEAANRGLSQFAAAVAHDLKNPLAGIEGNAELVKMLSADLSPDAVTALDRVIELSTSVSTMIDGLLQFARSPTAAGGERVSVRDAAEWTVWLLGDQLDAESATVTIDGDVDALGNLAALRQVLMNVVSNSIRYREPSRTPNIGVYLSEGDGSAQIRVTDNGIGIPAEMRDRVFEWGTTGDVDGRGPGGTGIGLAACRAVMANMAGTILIADHDGVGTVIELTLPSAGR